MKTTKRKITERAEVDARVGDALVEVKFGVDGIRAIRSSVMQVAFPMSADPALRGYVVLADSAIAKNRVRDEWTRISAVLRPEVSQRLAICMMQNHELTSIPADIDSDTWQMLTGVVEAERGRAGGSRTDYAFVILKLLIQRWLTTDEPVTADWLARTAGCHYPAVARALQSLGGLIERSSDRRVRLRWFPEEEFMRMIANSSRARSTMRFRDESAQPRSIEAHLRRLEKLAPPGLALGGVLGARHYFPALDLVGSPRLDLSLHSPGKHLNVDFIQQLDPALKLVTDPLLPATVVVHAVSHAESLFTSREGGLAWADPVECLLDLHEGRLEMQARQFLAHLHSLRPARS
ncbi:MAG: hypothetical protein ACKVY0_08090 [Prosthecobacter sp.]|uniref:hypothetical protein n=1 Tax=Prosthecobacter sp. TaxID=1965333 RepID=UPI003900BC8E